MTAKHPTTTPAPLREQLARHLDASPESPVKAIAKACGQADYPSRIVAQLNVMRTDGDVECEPRKGEMRYWLARPLEVILSGEQVAVTATPREAETQPAPTRQTERAEQRREMIRTAIAGKTAANGPTVKDLADACACTGQAVEQLVAPMISAGTVRKVRNEGERFNRFFDPLAIAPPQPEVGENTGSDGSAVQVPDDSTEAVAVQQPAPAPAPTPSPEPVAEDDTTIKPGDDHPTRAVKLAVRHFNGRQDAEEVVARLGAFVDEIRAAIGDDGGTTLDGLTERIRQMQADANELHAARKVLGQHDALFSRATKAEAERDELAQQYKDKDAELLNQASVVVSLRAELTAAEQKRIETTGALTRSMQDLDAIREHLAPFSVQIDPSDMTEVELAQCAAAAIRDGMERIFSANSTDVAVASEAVDVLEAASAYLIRIPKRRPRIVTKPEKVREAAVAAVRNGAARADVFALIPLGTAKRGAEWTDAN